jgi:hypothetical protein
LAFLQKGQPLQLNTITCQCSMQTQSRA